MTDHYEEALDVLSHREAEMSDRHTRRNGSD